MGVVESGLFSVVQWIGAGRHSYVTVDPAPFRKLFPFCHRDFSRARRGSFFAKPLARLTIDCAYPHCPPTAFTPEPVRRRLAGMKQVLLMIAVVVGGCANDGRAKRLEEENRRLKAELESLKGAKVDFKIAGTYRSTEKLPSAPLPEVRDLGPGASIPYRESWDTMEYRMLDFSESGATADNVNRNRNEIKRNKRLLEPPVRAWEWKLKDGELHADFGTGGIEIFEINHDASLTRVGFFSVQVVLLQEEDVYDTILMRHNLSEEDRETFIKVK